MSSQPPSQSGVPDPVSGTDPDQDASPPRQLRACRTREWFGGLGEAGKVTLVAAVITTVGGGLFGLGNAVLPALLSGGESDKPGEERPVKAAHSGSPSGHPTAAGPGTSPMELPGCSDFPDGWDPKANIGWDGDFDVAQQHVDFADIDGDGRDDYLVVDRETGAVKAWKYVEGDEFGRPDRTIDGHIPAGSGENTEVMFADLDGDGRDDHLTADTASGAVHAWANRDSGKDRRPEEKALGKVLDAGPLDGGPPAFGNVDCDKRADFLVATTAKPVNARLNRGTGSDGAFSWRRETQISEGGALNMKTQDRDFADLDGDGRDDFLWITRATGVVTPWVNRGGDPGT